MKLKTIDGHTICMDDKLFHSDGIVIDAGCRGWNFTYEMLGFKDKVVAIDIENFSDVPHDTVFINAALSTSNYRKEAHFFGNGTANFIKGLNGEPGNTPDRPVETKIVECITLDEIYAAHGTNVDVLKLDIESSEYDILLDLKPIPKQITVEFHEHTTKEMHDKLIDPIMAHLCRYYNCSLHIREWPQYKFMDCLFIRKDML